MKETILKKENSVVTVCGNDESIRSEITNISNPCFECKNGYVTKCPKIADEIKKNISEYDFITDGYQVYDENGDVSNLAITKCSNFEKEERSKLTTREELANLRRIKESIKILYFDAESIEDADRTQRDLYLRGSLVPYNAHLTSNSQNKKR